MNALEAAAKAKKYLALIGFQALLKDIDIQASAGLFEIKMPFTDFNSAWIESLQVMKYKYWHVTDMPSGENHYVVSWEHLK